MTQTLIAGACALLFVLAAARAPEVPLPVATILALLAPPLLALPAGTALQRRLAAGAGAARDGDAAAAAPFPGWLLAFLAVYLLSGAATAPNAFFAGWTTPAPAPGLLRAPLFTVSLAVAAGILLVPLLGGRARVALALALLVGSQVIVAATLFAATGGAALYHDDHPSSMYRLASFAQVFPQLAYYDPLWNAGGRTTFLLSSGTVPLGLLFWPIWRWVPVLDAYTPVLAAVFIGAVPWIVGGSVRFAGGGWAAAAVAGTLALGVCREQLLHLLHFGTVGSLFCTVFVVPIAAALHRAVWQGRRDAPTALVLCAASVLFLSWPGSVFGAAVILGALALSAKRLAERGTLRFLALCAVAILVLLSPLLVPLARHAPIGGAVTADAGGILAANLPAHLWRQLGELLRGGNPLLLALGAIGVLVLGNGWRALLGPALAGLLLLAAIGDAWKPTLQLSRAVIPFFLLACLPAGLLCGTLIEGTGRRRAAAAGLILALVGASTASVVGHYRQFTAGPYDTYPGSIRRLVAWLRAETAPGERILFAGTTVHGFGGGHVALLPLLAGREMLAGDYYAFSPKMVETELPPATWRRRGVEGVREYLELHRVGWCLTHHAHYKRFFRSHPELFEESISIPQTTLTITAFRVRSLQPHFIEGTGSASGRPGAVDVRLDAPGEALLRYRWVNGLVADGGVRLEPETVGAGLVFIRAQAPAATRFRIALP